jgi:hypothetical protein
VLTRVKQARQQPSQLSLSFKHHELKGAPKIFGNLLPTSQRMLEKAFAAWRKAGVLQEKRHLRRAIELASWGPS